MKLNLSKAQVQIYGLEKVVGGTSCNITASFLRSGNLDEGLMKKAADCLYRNHDAMRMQIIDEPVPKQEVKKSYNLEECYQYLSFQSKEEFENWVRKKADEPIGIKGYLTYIYGINIDNEMGGILYHGHHIVSDGYASTYAGKEFFSYYDAYAKGEEPEINAVSYVTYLEEEEKYLNSEKYEKDRVYWKEQYQQDITSKISHKPINCYDASRITFFESRSKELMQLCKERNVSIFNTYTTALGMYIAKENQTNSSCIGTALLNRMSKQEKAIIGMLVNTVGICATYEDDTDFVTNIKSVKAMTFSAMRHQKCNFVDAIRNNNGMNLDSTYDAYVSYQNSLPGSFKTTWYFCGAQNTNLAVSIIDWPGEDELEFYYDYRHQAFSEEEVYKIHEHLMEFMINGLRSDLPWDEISFIGEKENEELENANQLTESSLDYHKSVNGCSVDTSIFKRVKSE